MTVTQGHIVPQKEGVLSYTKATGRKEIDLISQIWHCCRLHDAIGRGAELCTMKGVHEKNVMVVCIL